jgi:hypothetical protein
MQRYSTKHFWRMKESEDGEFVRYDDAKQLLDEYEKLMYDMYKEEQEMKWEERRKVRYFRYKVYVMYCIIIGMLSIAFVALVRWSFGL